MLQKFRVGEHAVGEVVNQIVLDPDTEREAVVALQRMLDLPGTVLSKD
jgi:hypothetical protein